jgi:alpha-galactosidase
MEPTMLDAGPTRVAYCVDDEGRLRQVGFGPDVDAGPLAFPAWLYPLAYPTYGEDPFAAPALRVTNADGTPITRLVCTGHERGTHEGGESLVYTLTDEVAPLTVRIHLRSWPDTGVIAQWVGVTNDQSGPVTLHEVAAAAPLLAGDDPHLDHFSGDWGAEFAPAHDRLTTGAKVLEARATTRPAHEVPPYVRYRPDGGVGETTGRVLAGSLAWGGNLRIAFERARHGGVRAWFGHLPTGADYVLDPGETFTTPTVVWAWSDAGTRPLTQRLHRWVRSHALRDGLRDRPVVVNNWEATGFAFDAARLDRFCRETAELGGEVFLLDDGWFGTEFPRDDDTQGLGDWDPDRRKLPHGLAGVGRSAAAAGVRFGVWVEPEMVNPRSVLHRDHPDWVVAVPGRERREERNQLQLDLCRPEVADHVVGVLDAVLDPANGADYVKWDANRMVTEPGSGALATDRQGNWPVDVVHATWAAMDRVMAAHPDAEMLLCASGGGRMDLGTLARFHDVWLSDDTDPVDRVRMQWHAAEFLPVGALAAHVTRWGQRPIEFACAVAMSARFGFDVNRDVLDDDEWAICRRATAAYRRLRPTVQRGDLVRLVSPEDGPSAALALVAGDRSEAVVFAYQLPARAADLEPTPESLRIDGLDRARRYDVTAIDLTSDDPSIPSHHTGAELADRGVAWHGSTECTAAILHVTAVADRTNRR